MSRITPRVLSGLALAAVLAVPVLVSRPAAGQPAPNPAREALLAAIERGKEIWNQKWGLGSQSCAECHGQGPNLMRGTRLKAYPRWDQTAGKVITGQQKLQIMIETKSKGQPFPLGSDDLNALEAYVSTLR